jgi:hypothetical protein
VNDEFPELESLGPREERDRRRVRRRNRRFRRFMWGSVKLLALLAAGVAVFALGFGFGNIAGEQELQGDRFVTVDYDNPGVTHTLPERTITVTKTQTVVKTKTVRRRAR